MIRDFPIFDRWPLDSFGFLLDNGGTLYCIGLVTLGGFFCSFVVVCMGCILAISRKLEQL